MASPTPKLKPQPEAPIASAQPLPQLVFSKLEDINLFDHLQGKGYLDKKGLWTEKAADAQKEGSIFNDLDFDYEFFVPILKGVCGLLRNLFFSLLFPCYFCI